MPGKFKYENEPSIELMLAIQIIKGQSLQSVVETIAIQIFQNDLSGQGLFIESALIFRIIQIRT